MAVAIIMDFPGATLAHYDDVLRRMGLEPGGTPPEGAIFHFCTQTEDGVRVVDVWETMAQFEVFAAEHIGPHSQAAGIPAPPTTTVHEVHNYFV